MIEIKNALQREPDNSEARLLLATSLMETGDPAGAVSEVRKAIVAGAPEDSTYPLLARALLAQGDFKKLTAELADRKLGTPAARVQLGIALATAVAAQGDLRRAKNIVSAALAEDPANPRGLLLQAQLAAQEGDMAQAGKLVETVLQNAPDDVEALMVKAQIEAAGGRRDEAIKLYERAVAADPRSLAARFALVSLTVLMGKHDIAKAQVAKMKEQQANDFRTMYSDALVSYVTGNPQHAHEVVERLVAARPDHLPSVFLSGLVDFQLGSNVSAETSLRKVLARSPEDANAGRILALVYLRQGRPADALEVLRPVLQRTPDDPALLRTVGEAYLASGNAKLAAGSYERASALDKGDVNSKVRLAQVRLASGETERAFSDLQSLANADPTHTQADLAIITEYIRRRQFDKALAAVDALEKKQPKAALPSVLRGSVYLAKRDLANARRAMSTHSSSSRSSMLRVQSRAPRHSRGPAAGGAQSIRSHIVEESEERASATGVDGIAATDGRKRRRGQGVDREDRGGEPDIGSRAPCADQRRSVAARRQRGDGFRARGARGDSQRPAAARRARA